MTEKVTAAEQAETIEEQAAAARRAYKRNWAKANRDKVRAHQVRYWAKKAAQAAQAAAGGEGAP